MCDFLLDFLAEQGLELPKNVVEWDSDLYLSEADFKEPYRKYVNYMYS